MKNILIILFSIIFTSNLCADTNTFPKYEGIVALENKNENDIYNIIRTSLSQLQLADSKELYTNEENKTITVSGERTFNYTLMMVRIDGRVLMNIDFKVKDGRFKYIITVTDVYVENYGGMKQSSYNDLINKPKSMNSKKVMPHVTRTVHELIERINTIGKTNTSGDNDDW